MTRIRAYRSTTVALAPLAATVLLALGACSQSPDADLQKKIADADARTAAAEARIKQATHADSNAWAAAGVTKPANPVADTAASGDLANDSPAGVQYAPYRDSHSGPSNDVP